MLGAAGALICLSAGTAVGIYFRDRRQARLDLLQGISDGLSGMRLLLTQERLGMCELLRECGGFVPERMNTMQFRKRLLLAAQVLSNEPLLGVEGAYQKACAELPIAWEHAEECGAMATLFAQLGSGNAVMKEQAVATCLRRLKPITQRAQEKAQTGGKLCMQLGMLVGLMVGIALW